MDYEILFNNVPCGLIAFRHDGTILHINKTLLEWIGVSEEDLLKNSFFDLLEKGGNLYYQLFVHPLLKMHKAVTEISLQIQSSEGSFPCLFSALVRSSGVENDEVIYASLFKITDRKKFENELLKKKTRVEEEKEAKTKALKEVAFEQSHLVRAPLANILGLISLLDQSDFDEETRHIISLLLDSSQQLDDIVNRIVNKTYL